MNTRRTQILVVVIAAAIAMSAIIRFDAEGYAKAFWDGYYSRTPSR